MSKAKTKKPTIEELEDALKQLNDYEVWMLRSLANILAIDNQGAGVIHNALIEAFLIHARILIEFLYKNKTHEDTVRASQYFTSDSHWETSRPPKTKLLEDTEQAAHEHLAHLTYTRLQGKKQWSFIEIAADIGTVLKLFHENLSDDFSRDSNV